MPKGESEKPRYKHRDKENKDAEKNKSQRQRFLDAARAAEADETGEKFSFAFGKIIPPRAKG